MKKRRLTLLSAVIVLAAHTLADDAQSSTTRVNSRVKFKLAQAALESGDGDKAYALAKASCLATDAILEGCLLWSELAEKRGNDKDVKRSLGSAIIIAPHDIRARTKLAVKLIAKEDYDWAKEHLEQALPQAKADTDQAILRYYLAYVLFKKKAFEEADAHFLEACPGLPEHMAQRCSYYQAIIAERRADRDAGVALLKKVGEGADETWRHAAGELLSSWSAFPKNEGFHGRLSGAVGVNTHPSSAFLDMVESDVRPVLQSVLRGDAIFGRTLGPGSFQATVTAYREDNWTELGKSSAQTPADESILQLESLDEYSEGDFNTTVFIGQAAYFLAGWGGGFEHELKLAVDGELQYLDHPPMKDNQGHYHREEDPFALIGWAAGGSLWWSFARTRDALYSVRLKIEGRPNRIDPDRSTSRYRLRVHHNRYFVNRALQLKTMIGARYDRSYEQAHVIKYDRFLPEAELSLKWRTPVPRLTVLAGARFKYNWYMNSRQNKENSFRPQYMDVHICEEVHHDDEEEGDSHEEEGSGCEGVEDYLNAYFEHEYYGMTRRDVEWEANGELQVKLWRGAEVAAVYKHHQRISNIDDAPTPRWIEGDTIINEEGGGTVITLPPPRYSYTRDLILLELRQRF